MYNKDTYNVAQKALCRFRHAYGKEPTKEPQSVKPRQKLNT